MIAAAAWIGCVAALAAAPPPSLSPPAPPSASPQPQPPAAPAFAGGALEVGVDHRVSSLERPAASIAGAAAAGPAVVERVDLVWGCRGDRRRALLLEGEHHLAAAAKDACAVRVDVRPPCPPAIDDSGLDDTDARALGAAAAEQHQAELGAHRQRMARLAAGFSAWGPGLRLVVSGGGPLRLTSSQLGLEACGCDGASARSLGDETVTIVLPKLDKPTVVWVPVPRYLGTLHRLSVGKAPPPGALSFTDPFHAEDDALEGAPGGLPEAFSAPAGCDCAACEE